MNLPSKFDPRGCLPADKKYKPRKPLSELLSRYTVMPNGCWEWTATRNKQGYGVIGIAIDKKPVGFPAPRLQWMHLHGEIQKGQVIMHTCDNPPCINPDHLRCGTQSDNLTDMAARGRANPKGVIDFMDKYRRGEVPFLGKYRKVNS